MSKTKLAVVYYSTYGTNHQMAEVAAEAARKAGAEVRLLKTRETAPDEVVQGQDAWREQMERTAHIPEATPEDMAWADAYFFSAPTRYGAAASQVRAFIDTLGPLWLEGKLANKAITAMSSAQNPHGGQETTIMSLYTTFMHWGAIIVPTGYTDEAVFASGGNPYGTSVTADGSPLSEEDKAAIRHQTERMLEVAAKLEAAEPAADESRLVGLPGNARAQASRSARGGAVVPPNLFGRISLPSVSGIHQRPHLISGDFLPGR